MDFTFVTKTMTRFDLIAPKRGCSLRRRICLPNQQQNWAVCRFQLPSSVHFSPISQVWWLPTIMPVSMSLAAVEQSAGRPLRLPLPPWCEHCSGEGTEWESGELLIPRTIGYLNPRQAPYLHWAKVLPALRQSRQNDHPSPCSQGSIIHEKRWMGCKQGMLTEGEGTAGGVCPEPCVSK